MTSSAGFTRAAFVLGLRRVLPLLIGVSPFGLVAGVVAQGQGLSFAEASLMSGVCYAGSAQLLALGHWTTPAPVLAATLSTLVVNLRLVLMGPVLTPWLDRVRGWRLWVSLFVMADQNWALAVRHMQVGPTLGEPADAAFLFGSGLGMWVIWLATTQLGYVLGSLLRPPAGHPLFFTALAVFVALLVPMWRGRADALPWGMAAGVSLLAFWVLPGTWYIVIGALAGAAAGAWRDRRLERSA